MLRPPMFRGAAFGFGEDGDARSDVGHRTTIATALGISPAWAWVRQVHGASVIRAATPGLQGEADALITTTRQLPLTVATADCVPVIIEGSRSVAVVHAGWRGVVAGVTAAAVDAMRASGDVPERAAIGPAIGPCCYEVGPEVVERLAPYATTTTWDTASVDLPAAVAEQLGDIGVWRAGICTHHDDRFHSYRRNGTRLRQVAVGWIPDDA